MYLCLGSGGSNHLNNTAPGGPSPAGGAADNVSVSNPFDDVSTNPQPRSGPFPGGAHPPYPTGNNTPPRPPPGQNYSGQPGGGYQQYPPGPQPGPTAPPDQYSPYSTNSAYPGVRPVYPPYSGDSGGGSQGNTGGASGASGAPPPQSPSNTQGGPPSTAPQDPYNRYTAAPPPGANYTPRPTYGTTPTNAGGPSTSQPPAGPAGPYAHQDYVYRPDQVLFLCINYCIYD